jgi:hypothetical protein
MRIPNSYITFWTRIIYGIGGVTIGFGIFALWNREELKAIKLNVDKTSPQLTDFRNSTRLSLEGAVAFTNEVQKMVSRSSNVEEKD